LPLLKVVVYKDGRVSAFQYSTDAGAALSWWVSAFALEGNNDGRANA
jgi:hypothetical protein